MLNLRKAAAYNASERGPLSSTSSRFNFNHLFFSPPPSPSLPALVPRRKKSQTRILPARPSSVFRRIVFLLGLLLAVYVAGVIVQGHRAFFTALTYFTQAEFEIVGQETLPDYPTPVVVGDSKGRPRWTVSIPQDAPFPLSLDQYSEISRQCPAISARTRDLNNKAPLSDDKSVEKDTPDDYFVDVYEAERAGMLPASGNGAFLRDDGHFVGMDKARMEKLPVCQSSMTFVLESADAGLGNALMMLWTFYGLAKEQERSFFIDDSRWAYGSYSEMFRMPPTPDCRPPPRHHMVPCPFEARHLVVSAVTGKAIFPALLAKHQSNSTTDDELRTVFELARTGYEDLFELTHDDKRYVDSRVRVMKDKTKKGEIVSQEVPIIGLHIRRGDQHPLEQQYRASYIPTEVFFKTVDQLVEDHYNASVNKVVEHHAITLLASDDPTVHEEPEFAKSLLAQERIRLASKGAIQQANPNPNELHQFVDETFGWEGGFFASMFWNLGADLKNNAANAATSTRPDTSSKKAVQRKPPSEETLKLRNFVGRAYMMDLAVLAGASDNVVCAVSAMGCQLIAVMQGWDHAMVGGGWVNIDGLYGWTGINW